MAQEQPCRPSWFPWPFSTVLRELRALRHQNAGLGTQLEAMQRTQAQIVKNQETIMSEQNEIDTDVQALSQGLDAIDAEVNGDLAAIPAEITAAIQAAQQANPQVDLSALDALAGRVGTSVSNLQTAVGQAQAAVPSQTPPSGS